MSEEVRVGVNMKKLDNIAIANNTPPSGFRDSLGGNNLPKVVGIIVSITSDLLTYIYITGSAKVKMHEYQLTNLHC